MIRSMKRAAFVGCLSLCLFGCQAPSQNADETVSNGVVDNTIGTASDAMTNVDATTGSAANMAADVPSSGVASSGSDNAAAPESAPAANSAQ